MKILSLNVRGLRDRAKRRRLRSLLLEGKFQCCFLQETKCSDVNSTIVESVWGGSEYNWVARKAEGLSGGLLIIWNSDLADAVFSFSGRGFVGVCAKWKTSNNICFLVNVYSPCDFDGKKELWKDLLLCKRCFGGGVWCVAGDFNAISAVEERRGASRLCGGREISGFNQFISDMELIDVSVLGKKYTWFSGDGSAKSRLDRFLLTEEAISTWKVAAQWVGNRDISDHCPIWLDCSSYDWGPKPFRFNNCWLQHKDFKDFVDKS